MNINTNKIVYVKRRFVLQFFEYMSFHLHFIDFNKKIIALRHEFFLRCLSLSSGTNIKANIIRSLNH